MVSPRPSHVLGRISPILSPFSPSFARFHRLAEAVPTSPKDRPRWAGFLNDSAVPQTACCCPTSTPTARAQAGGAPASSAARMARAANPSLPSRASGGVSPTDWFRLSESRKWSRNKRWATDASISARRAGSFTFFGAFKQAGGVLDQLVMGDCDHLQTMLLVF